MQLLEADERSYLETLMEAKRARDLIRERLVAQLNKYNIPLPYAVRMTLTEDKEATEAFHSAWNKYQVHKAISEMK